MKTTGKARVKRTLVRLLVVVPPVLFLIYATHGLIMVRGLLSQSVGFHLDYANELVQDFLALEIAFEAQVLQNKLLAGELVREQNFVTLNPNSAELGRMGDAEDGRPYYLRQDELVQTLPRFFVASKGLSALFTERFHQPVYWFRIIDLTGRAVYTSGTQPVGKEIMATYSMERTLKGHRIQIIYNSFGPSQLYSVARTKINFGGLLLLFALAVFSAALLTHSIRQKIVLARQKTYFVSTVSHEFKTPLAIMKLAAETLAAKRFKKPEDETRFRGMLVTEVNRLDHLVQKILNFNKMEMGQIQYHKRRIDLRVALQPTIDYFQAQAQADGVVLRLSLDAVPCWIDGDPDLLRHAVDNLLDNAFKYRGASTSIEFSCLREDGQVRVAVTDHGIGIPADEIAHIHKSFYRVHDPVLQGVRGSGLGLAITASILEMAGGSLEIQSEHGQGSTFTLIFHEAETAAAAAAEPDEEA